MPLGMESWCAAIAAAITCASCSAPRARDEALATRLCAAEAELASREAAPRSFRAADGLRPEAALWKELAGLELRPEERGSAQDDPGAVSGADASNAAPPESSEGERAWAFQSGVGFTIGPDMFLVPFVLETKIAPELWIGPSVQVAVSDDETFFAPGAELRWVLAEGAPNGEFLDRVSPFFTAGIGLAYLEKERRAGDDDDWGLLLDVGLGAEFRIDERISVGSRMVFDWFPADLVGEHFLFTWQVVTLRIRF
jgi:hypothetical protein